MPDYPAAITEINHVAPVARRIRGFLGGRTVVDTSAALYVWESRNYPQYYVPRADVQMDWLTPDGEPISTPQGTAQTHAIDAGTGSRPAAARLIVSSQLDELVGRVRIEWDALDAWYEEDERVFVHPRSPYTRVDALRSTRVVRIELDGIELAESPAPVMVFETGLPTRYYVDARRVRFEHLVASATRTECPYKGRTTGYWSVATGTRTHVDLAWMYSFPTAALLPIAGLVAFLNEKVDISLDGVAQARPQTHMGG